MVGLYLRDVLGFVVISPIVNMVVFCFLTGGFDRMCGICIVVAIVIG